MYKLIIIIINYHIEENKYLFQKSKININKL